MFKYDLEKYNGTKTRHTCPNCGRKNCFTLYVDPDGNYFGDDIGRCDHIQSCGYDKTPQIDTLQNIIKYINVKERAEPSFIKDEDVIGDKYGGNLYWYFRNLWSEKTVNSVWSKYDVRCINEPWIRSELFYQIGKNQKYYAGKIINYDYETGKRIKEPIPRISWLHAKNKEYVLEQHLFGEHLLLEYNANVPVFLLESEKAALICSISYPEYIFLATGGMNNISREKLLPLAFRNVTALPDKGAYKYWKDKLEKFNIKVSDVLERTDEVDDGSGYDDYILKHIKQ